MTKIIPIFIAGMLLALVSQHLSLYKLTELGDRKYVKKDILIFGILIVVLTVFVGLRTNYNDTSAYRHMYELMGNTREVFREIDWSLGSNPGFHFLNGCFRILGISTQNFLMIYAVLTVPVYLWFIRKYSDNFALSIFLFFTMGCYTFTMAAIKQCVAVSFCMIATDRALQKKWIRFVFWIIIASLFHPYALMYLVIPILQFRPWSRYTYALIVLTGFVGVGLQSLLGSIVNITTMLGEEYDTSSFSQDGVNIFRVAVVWVPVIISFLCRKFLRRYEDKKMNVIINLATLNAEIMFIGLFGTANYFARLANYFLMFQALALPYLFRFFKDKSRYFLIGCCVIGYLAYFYYAMAIANGGFDIDFQSITLWQYLSRQY